MDIDVPHIAFPITVDSNGAVGVVEQDSIDDVSQCVEVLLSTPIGSRIELPEYGIPEILFAQTIDLIEIADAVAEWEPRAAIDLSADIDSRDELIRHIAANVGTP